MKEKAEKILTINKTCAFERKQQLKTWIHMYAYHHTYSNVCIS